MNDKEKLDMIKMAYECVSNGVDLEYIDKDIAVWIDSNNVFAQIAARILDGVVYRQKKQNTCLDEAIKLVSENGYEVVKKPEVKKFVPFPGQLVYVEADGSIMRRFSHMKDSMYMCFRECSLKEVTDWEECYPIPGLVQFQPMSELEDGYKRQVNILYENGRILHWKNAGDISSIHKAVGFQKLDN